MVGLRRMPLWLRVLTVRRLLEWSALSRLQAALLMMEVGVVPLPSVFPIRTFSTCSVHGMKRCT